MAWLTADAWLDSCYLLLGIFDYSLLGIFDRREDREIPGDVSKSDVVGRIGFCLPQFIAISLSVPLCLSVSVGPSICSTVGPPARLAALTLDPQATRAKVLSPPSSHP